ncbi:hypothetical protein M8494_01730 [Serratia ureilytica]
MIKAMGYSGGRGIDILFIALYLAIIILIISSLPAGLIIPFILLCALYAPVGAIYGSPSAAVVSALLQTNSTEASEFRIPSPARVYLLPVVIFTMLIILKKVYWRQALPKNHIAFAGVICGYRHHQNIQRLAELKLPGLLFIHLSAYDQYQQQIDELNTGVSESYFWSFTSGAPKNENAMSHYRRRKYAQVHTSLFAYPVSTHRFG